jgi:multiple sugar transport system substrate-binding protein
MKQLFLITLTLLVGFSQFINIKALRNSSSDHAPVLMWSTDADPLRQKQSKRFRDWLKKNNYPDINLKVDSANQGGGKQIILGVSGVASDLMQLNENDVDMTFKVGLIKSISGDFEKMGLTVEDIQPAIRDNLNFDGKMIGYPLNLSLIALIVNRAKFRELGMEVPTRKMSVDTFETMGREYLKRANAGKKNREFFFVHAVNPYVLLRSLGVSLYNETLTGGALNRSETAMMFKKYSQWINTEHLIPSAAEMASFSTEQNTGGVEHQLLVKGVFGMIQGGRLASAFFRRMNATNLDYTIIENPSFGYVNTYVAPRMIVVYTGSQHPELALYFIKYLASAEYNLAIAKDGEALPPNPKFMTNEEYLNPAGDNEKEFHRNIAEMAKTSAIGREYSPYIDLKKTLNLFNYNFSGYLGGYISLEEAVKTLDEDINKEIKRKVAQNADLRESYTKALERQKQIDAIKAKNAKIPLDLVDNTFLKRYYKDTGKGE